MEPLADVQEVSPPETPCKRCGNPVVGIVLVDTPIPRTYCDACSAVVVAEEDAVAHAETLQLAETKAGGTPRLLRYELATHPNPAAVTFGRSWLRDYRLGARQNLWLGGSVGTGKTSLAWSLVRELVRDAVGEFFATDEVWRPAAPRDAAMLVVWRDLLDELRSAIGVEASGADQVFPFLRRVRGIPVLALDDLGSERPTKYALEQLAIVVDQRYQNELPTIVTSNYRPEDFAAILGDDDPVIGRRIVSRLAEGARSMRFDGPNLRLAAS